MPQRGDDLIFNAGGRNCNALNPMQGGGGPIEGFGSSPYDFNSISVLSGYSGSVIVQSTILVGDLVLTGGDLRQPNGDLSTVNVANTFNWTDGTLNASTSRSTLAIRGGATATIDPPDTSALVTGSTLSFQGDATTSTGSTGTVDSGTVQFNNGANFNVSDYCSVDIKVGGAEVKFQAASDLPPDPLPVTNGRVNLNGGIIKVSLKTGTTAGIWNDKMPIRIAKGTLQIDNGTTAKFDGRLPATIQQTQPSVYMDGTGSVISIQDGGKMEAVNGAWLQGGRLQTRPIATDLPPLGGAEVVGNVTIAGANIRINPDSSPHFYGKLVVTGDVSWQGGTYTAHVNGKDTTNADLWEITGKLTVGGIGTTPRIAVQVDDPPAGGVPAGTKWKIIEATGGITIAPLTAAPDIGPGWELEGIGGNPPKEWYAKKK